MKCRVLGPLDVTSGTHNVTPTAPKLREILALLVVQNGRTVTISDLIDEIWGQTPPVTAQSTLQTYIYKLRKSLEGKGLGDGSVVVTRPNGYTLQVPDGDIDVHRFEQAVRDGRKALADSPDKALESFQYALSLWRGPALADVTAGEVLTTHVARLEADHLSAIELKIEADLKLGNHHAVVSELTSLSTAHPLHENFHSLLMLALHRSGRRSEALQVYNQLRSTLVEELGLEPSQQLRDVQQAVLAGDPHLGLAQEAAIVTSAPTPDPRPAHRATPHETVQPAQLPPDPGPLVGQDDLLDTAVRTVRKHGGGRDGIGVLLLTGMPGVGKSALAARVAHSVRARYRGGQLYADLGGSQSRPANPDDVLTGFLRAAGFPEPFPRDLGEKSSLFRSWGAEREVLVVLDDALTHSQVLPLLPGAPHSTTIVASRVRLCNLPNSRTLEVAPLSSEESLQLLSRTAGPKRIQAEQRAAAEVAEMCGNLPLALRSAGARLATLRNLPISGFAEQLYSDRSRLDQLQSSQLDIRSRYLVAYGRLGTRERAVLRLLSLLSHREFTASTLTELLDCTEAVADTALSNLVEHHFLYMKRRNGKDGAVYAFHELSRIFARERMESELACAPAPAPLADAS
jgi:DNA-binding SARP family transcriptional activator/predicted transcriptional regulator